MDSEKKRSDLDDLIISISRLLHIRNEIIEECHRQEKDPVQLMTAVSAVELYANKVMN